VQLQQPRHQQSVRLGGILTLRGHSLGGDGACWVVLHYLPIAAAAAAAAAANAARARRLSSVSVDNGIAPRQRTLFAAAFVNANKRSARRHA